MSEPEKPEPDAEIWRYLSFHQLVSLLDREELYFCRADRLGDPFEGSLPVESVREEEELLESTSDLQEGIRGRVPNYRERNKKYTFLNCWHRNPEGESAAMWNLYASNGVAIKTNFSDLEEALSASDEDIILRQVTYLDYRPDGESMEIEARQNWWGPFVHKRNSFKHEQEVRALIFKPVKVHPQSKEEKREVKPEEVTSTMLSDRLFIEVELPTLIQEIRISPDRGDDFLELVENVVKEYGHDDIAVEQSDLAEDPVY